MAMLVLTHLAHHSEAQTDESRRLFGEWRKTREKLGLGPDDTSFIDDPKEAERVGQLKRAAA